MKAIRIHQPGDINVLQFEDCDKPAYGPDDVLIEIKAAGINFIDIYTRTGFYKPPHYPFIPGKEGSGVVTAIGANVKEFKLGDRVAFCMGGTGSYAEYTAVPAQMVVLIPDEVSFEIAAAIMLQGLTAYYLSHLTFPLHENNTALVHAGAGGVGLLLIQMAKMLKATVYTTVSSDDKAKLAKEAGADEVILYTRESFLEKIQHFTHGAGVHVVYDSVGKTTFTDSLKSLSIRGMLVSFGQSSGAVPPLLLAQLAEKSSYLTRPTLSHYTLTKAELNDMAAPLFKLVVEKKLNVLIGQRYPLAEAGKAQEELEGRKTVGKSILVV